jgi:hypothetical protein
MGATNLTHFTSRYTINQRFLESPDWKGFARFVLVTHLLRLRNQWMTKGRALELGRAWTQERNEKEESRSHDGLIGH